MKKIVALGVAAALVGGLAFAGEPAANSSVVSFTGNASVEWGVDLDAGKTGFKNGTWTEFKLKLFDNGEKSTSADGDIWAELKIKVDDDSSCGPNGFKDGAWLGGKNAYIDVAKLHFGNVYVGIKSGDTKTGTLDFTTAVRSADPWFHPGRWLNDVGPDKFTQGIVVGYEDDNMDINADFRSYEDGQYTDAYAFAAEAKLKDTGFVEGLSAGIGASYNLADKHFKDSTTETKATEVKKFDIGFLYNDKNNNGKKDAGEEIMYDHLLGYSANVGYKLKIDDTYWLKPQVGLTGWFATEADADAKTSWQANGNTIAAGVMFGWGSTNSYGSTGLYYFDANNDQDKGTTPGISAIVYMPLPLTATSTSEVAGTKFTAKSTQHDSLTALIVPSVYSGDLVENLKFAAYSEMGLFDYRETQPSRVVSGNTSTSEYYKQTKDGKNTFALALAAGVKYDIKADEITVTPKAAIRYANSCYVANKEAIDAAVPASNKTIFNTGKDGLGIQKKNTEGERNGLLAGDFFNLEAGVDVAGLINNTTFSVHYKSANLLNATEYNDKTYNVKLGTLNVGCKIAF